MVIGPTRKTSKRPLGNSRTSTGWSVNWISMAVVSRDAREREGPPDDRRRHEGARGLLARQGEGDAEPDADLRHDAAVEMAVDADPGLPARAPRARAGPDRHGLRPDRRDGPQAE